MSEISRDLQAQLSAGMEPLLRRFLEKKPDCDGATLTEADETRLRLEENKLYEQQTKEALRR